MAKMKEKPPEEGAPAWMATFSDLMNLLLCFFVLLFASSTMDAGKIQKIAASFNNSSFSIINNGTLSLLSGEMMSSGVTMIPDIQQMMREAGKNVEGEEVDYVDGATVSDASLLTDEELRNEMDKRGEEESEEIYDEVVEMTESYDIEEYVTIDYNAQYVQLDLNGAVLFDSGSVEIKPDAKIFMQKIARVLTKYKYNIIEIEGHTDNVPMNTAKYADNRELSTGRARSVYEFITSEEHFIDENIKIAGYGESRPIASNATAEGRARNRRVCIKIYNEQNSNN